MQTGEGDGGAGDAAALANLATILSGINAALPPGPPQSGSGNSPGHVGQEGSPTEGRTSNGGGTNQAGAGGGLSPGLILLPAGLNFPLQLNGPAGLQNLAPYLSLLPSLAPGTLGADGMPYPGLPGMDLNGQLNLAALLAGGTLEGLDPATLGAMDLTGLADPGRKGPMSGSKRGNDGSGPSYKRERSEEGRARESIPNLPHLKGKCHVDGCSADLTGLSSYYQRYRTCEAHLKAPSIMKDGIQQRFCQQCGRFHELAEFDGNKRSCRSRLASHNVRRRKRTEEAMASQAAAESHGVHASSGAPGGMGGQGLGQLPLQQQHLLGGQQLTDLLQPGGLESLLSMATDPTKQGKTADEALAAFLGSLPAGLLTGNLGDPTNQAIQLALQAVSSTAPDNLGQPLLDSLLKAGAAGGPTLTDLPNADLQSQLALALAAAPAAAAALGDGSGGGLDAATLAAAAAHLQDPRLGHHDPHGIKAEGTLGGLPQDAPPQL
ncbi:hypothetical protein GPECTOR_4g709 [Gonium pectorale]|uniref:SBP-type domain-containing protein n=1 Tax=Gonium pectorale TaxID=33097 RepID=A0A150GY12_GONPE|nr:hypothetical protein GPECTOR_4g709 [Gonium pectorale]|eukprot:KXZ54643.1 hypothetical protein GPECTOR_4g709 [Gonium pectorale]